MPSIQLETQESVHERLVNRVVARTGITDLTDSGDVHELLLAVAREFDGAYFEMALFALLFDLDKASGDDLDRRAAEVAPRSAELRRLGARRSIGKMQLARSSTSGTATYPAGIVGLTDAGVAARTTEQATIADGDTDSDAVAGVAVVAGADGNIDVGAVVRFQSKPAGVVTITNITRFVGGRDRETDDEYRTRIRAYIAKLARASARAILGATLGVEDTVSGKVVRFQRLRESLIQRGEGRLYIDDGAGTAAERVAITAQTVIAAALGGEEYTRLASWRVDEMSTFTLTRTRSGSPTTLVRGTDFYLDPSSGLIFFTTPLEVDDIITATAYTAFTGLVHETQRVVDGDETDEITYPGYRAAGVFVQVIPATVVVVPIVGVVTFTETVETEERETVLETVVDAILAYTNNIGLTGAGEQSRIFVRERAIAAALGVAGVFDFTMSRPAENRRLAEDEVIRNTAANVTVTGS